MRIVRGTREKRTGVNNPFYLWHKRNVPLRKTNDIRRQRHHFIDLRIVLRRDCRTAVPSAFAIPHMQPSIHVTASPRQYDRRLDSVYRAVPQSLHCVITQA